MLCLVGALLGALLILTIDVMHLAAFAIRVHYFMPVGECMSAHYLICHLCVNRSSCVFVFKQKATYVPTSENSFQRIWLGWLLKNGVLFKLSLYKLKWLCII